MFRSNFDDFFESGTTGACKVENQVSMTRLSPETYPHFLGGNSYCFPLFQQKNVSVEFLTTFLRVLPEHAKLKIGPEWLGFAPETYPHYLGYSSYRFQSVRRKNVSVKFWRLFRVRVLPDQAKLKIGSGWLGLPPKHIPTLFVLDIYV